MGGNGLNIKKRWLWALACIGVIWALWKAFGVLILVTMGKTFMWLVFGIWPE